MNHLRITGMSCVLVAICALPLGCSVAAENSEPTETISQALPPGHCNQSTAKDTLIAQLVKDSWVTGYPLTRLSADANGAIVGSDLPDAVAGDLEIINTVEEARQAVARALVKVTGLPEYEIAGVGGDIEACTGVPAWTPNGSTTINTTSTEIFPGALNYKSWRTAQKEFSKECPLVKSVGELDLVDPPGDGSTNDPPSATVSASGVTANAWGNCPAGTVPGTYCKLSYAVGVNYTGRICTVYYGSNRCLLF
ncbi:MAG TPA: hypothetical protein VKP30_25845 [Polyangiaceae bacterium]|nr:hypothetical protein [Polyangiaceae bacterium]